MKEGTLMHSKCTMISDQDISITLTSFFMKCCGLWVAANPAEQQRRNFALIYTISAIFFAVWVETRDFYYTWGDFADSTYIACNILCLFMVLFKIFILIAHKVDFINLILYTRKNFWHSNYDDYEKSILNNCRITCTSFISFFTFFAQGTVAGYVVTPIFGNLGKNESDRELPFNMWLNLPLSYSPYYEILFVLQTLSLYHVGISYFCFDNFLCIMNVHVAGQFRVLQNRLRNIFNYRTDQCPEKASEKYANECYEKLKNCIREHQSLIIYCEKLEKIFTMIVLGQVLVFSILMCLVGYQILMVEAPLTRRLIFIFHIVGSLGQLMMFTYSCDGLIHQSSNIGIASYSGLWTNLPMTKSGHGIRRDLLFMIARTRKPCFLSAAGFFPVSLETYTAVLSTAMSYFTLLRNNTVDK